MKCKHFVFDLVFSMASRVRRARAASGLTPRADVCRQDVMRYVSHLFGDTMRNIYPIAMTVIMSCSASSHIPYEEGLYANYGHSQLKAVSTDASYGYTEANPIKVGGSLNGGAANQKMYLNALLGPNGEAVRYKRLGSCCPFKTQNAVFGDSGLLDMYEVTYRGLKKAKVLYLNFYDSDELYAPIGFSFKN